MAVAVAVAVAARHLQRALLDVLEVLVFDDREEAEGGDGDERVLVVDLCDVRRPLVVEVAPLLLDPRDHRRLVEADLAGGLAEVAARRGVDAVGAGAEVDPVQVERQDAVFAELPLEPEGQHGFLDVADLIELGDEGLICNMHPIFNTLVHEK